MTQKQTRPEKVDTDTDTGGLMTSEDVKDLDPNKQEMLTPQENPMLEAALLAEEGKDTVDTDTGDKPDESSDEQDESDKPDTDTAEEPEWKQRLQEKESYIGSLENEKAELRRMLYELNQRIPLANQDNGVGDDSWFEEFQTNPQSALRKAGVVSAADIATLQQEIGIVKNALATNTIANQLEQREDLKDIGQYFRQHGDYPRSTSNARWNSMMKAFDARPALRNLPPEEAIDLLYELTNGSGKPQVEKVSPGRKSAAQTSSGSSTRKLSGDIPTKAEFDAMSEKQLLAWYKDRGLIT